ncbi:MAG TPA: sigma-70 family RNA polymerase sigma factor [Candidatus Acidoferrales bacterium]|nr:sigma-70 family RNA polymerase sigma factor [Candidatus Acidoferrales bacterium]
MKADQVSQEPRLRGNQEKSSGEAREPEALDLVRQAQTGDEAAFARLVEPHMRKTFHVALKITRNREDAEDASQQTLLKAFANIRQFQGASQFSTWLIRIAMNEALMVMRKRRSEDSHLTYDFDSGERPSAIERICAADTAQPEVLYAKREHQEALREAIRSLRGTLRVVVWMLGIEEHKSKDAAKILNLSQSAVKIRFSRARQELRECLADRM